MISKWKLFNFKSVADETTLDFRPLTLFAGPNSSGKSTCIQSILLICQTLRNPIGSRPVILNGALTRLGQFNDLKSAGSDANAITVGWTLEPAESERTTAREVLSSVDDEWMMHEVGDTQLLTIESELSFDASLAGASDSTQLNPELFSVLLRAKTRDSEGLDHSYHLGLSRASDAGQSKLLSLRNLGADDAEVERVRASAVLNVETDQESADDIVRSRRSVAGAMIGADLSHFLPSQIAVSYNRSEDKVRVARAAIFNSGRLTAYRIRQNPEVLVPPEALAILRDALQPVQLHVARSPELDVLLSSNQSVPLISIVHSLRALPSENRGHVLAQLQSDQAIVDGFAAAMKTAIGDDYRTMFVSLPGDLDVTCDYVRDYFSRSVRYLGPLRDEPKALYPLAGSADPTDVGLKGENTAAVLDLHKNRLVRLISPAAFAQPAVSAEPISRTLKTAVTEWLKYLGVAENVESLDRGKLGHELKIRIDERSGDQDLTHVGVGVSQVLPILVMCLLADPDTVLLFEQPELHLHPKVQTLLGDFFLSMALLKKQCIIETHSEYLINRLRFRAAAAESDKVASQMTIYFVEKKEDKSHFRPIIVNEFGAIQDWPEGFFDQSQREAEETLKAAFRKKKEQKAGPGKS